MRNDKYVGYILSHTSPFPYHKKVILVSASALERTETQALSKKNNDISHGKATTLGDRSIISSCHNFRTHFLVILRTHTQQLAS